MSRTILVGLAGLNIEFDYQTNWL